MAQNIKNFSAESLAQLAQEAAAEGRDPQEAVAEFVEETLEQAKAVTPSISSDLATLSVKGKKGKKGKK